VGRIRGCLSTYESRRAGFDVVRCLVHNMVTRLAASRSAGLMALMRSLSVRHRTPRHADVTTVHGRTFAFSSPRHVLVCRLGRAVVRFKEGTHPFEQQLNCTELQPGLVPHLGRRHTPPRTIDRGSNHNAALPRAKGCCVALWPAIMALGNVARAHRVCTL